MDVLNEIAHNASIPLLIDAVIVFTLLEIMALTAWRRATGRGPAWRHFGMNILSGLCLMLALRCLARDAGPAWVAVCLLAAGIAHGADMVRLQR